MPLEICPQLDTVRCPLRRKPDCDDKESVACVFLKQTRASASAVTALMALELPIEIRQMLSTVSAMLNEKA